MLFVHVKFIHVSQLTCHLYNCLFIYVTIIVLSLHHIQPLRRHQLQFILYSSMTLKQSHEEKQMTCGNVVMLQ